jgi:hypothetical protein
MGQKNSSSYEKFKNFFATDYMLENVLIWCFLLVINTFYLYKIDVSRKNTLLISQNKNTTISSKLINTQSAENCSSIQSHGSACKDKEFSETVRQLPDIEEYTF